jgi:hypothetical protein
MYRGQSDVHMYIMMYIRACDLKVLTYGGLGRCSVVILVLLWQGFELCKDLSSLVSHQLHLQHQGWVAKAYFQREELITLD